MKDQFYLHFDTMPAGTAQQKRYNTKTGTYYKDAKLKILERQFRVALFPHRPKTPSTKPIKLVVWFAWDVKDKKLWGTVKPTTPDTDNYIKEFKDVMADLGFFKSDAQIVDEHIYKTYAENATIMVMWKELNDTSDAYIHRETEAEEET